MTPNTILTTIAGQQFAPAGMAKLRAAEPPETGYHSIELVPEPDNKYDLNAIRVDFEGEKLGYIPRVLAKGLRASGWDCICLDPFTGDLQLMVKK